MAYRATLFKQRGQSTCNISEAEIQSSIIQWLPWQRPWMRMIPGVFMSQEKEWRLILFLSSLWVTKYDYNLWQCNYTLRVSVYSLCTAGVGEGFLLQTRQYIVWTRRNKRPADRCINYTSTCNDTMPYNLSVRLNNLNILKTYEVKIWQKSFVFPLYISSVKMSALS